MTSKLGRPLGRPRSRASLLGHPGTSAGEGWARLPPPPGPPPPRTAPGGGGLLTLTLRGKAMDGFEEQQERNRPQLCPPSLGNRRTDAGFPQASTGRRRSVACRSLGLLFTTNGTYNRQKSDAGNTVNPSTQSGQVHRLVRLMVAAGRGGRARRQPRRFGGFRPDTAGGPHWVSRALEPRAPACDKPPCAALDGSYRPTPT